MDLNSSESKNFGSVHSEKIIPTPKDYQSAQESDHIFEAEKINWGIDFVYDANESEMDEYMLDN